MQKTSKFVELFIVGIVSSLIGGACVAFVANRYWLTNHSQIETRRLIIVDADGKQRAVLEAQDDGSAVLGFFSKDKKPVLTVGMQHSTPIPGISSSIQAGLGANTKLFNDKGELGIQWSLLGPGYPIETFYGPEGEIHVQSGAIPRPNDVGAPDQFWGFEATDDSRVTRVGVPFPYVNGSKKYATPEIEPQ